MYQAWQWPAAALPTDAGYAQPTTATAGAITPTAASNQWAAHAAAYSQYAANASLQQQWWAAQGQYNYGNALAQQAGAQFPQLAATGAYPGAWTAEGYQAAQNATAAAAGKTPQPPTDGNASGKSAESAVKGKAPTSTDDFDKEEEEFERQFKDWEKQFEAWKEQNVNHPDKEAFAGYERQWQEWRNQLLVKKEQMQQAKANRAQKQEGKNPDPSESLKNSFVHESSKLESVPLPPPLSGSTTKVSDSASNQQIPGLDIQNEKTAAVPPSDATSQGGVPADASMYYQNQVPMQPYMYMSPAYMYSSGMLMPPQYPMPNAGTDPSMMGYNDPSNVPQKKPLLSTPSGALLPLPGQDPNMVNDDLQDIQKDDMTIEEEIRYQKYVEDMQADPYGRHDPYSMEEDGYYDRWAYENRERGQRGRGHGMHQSEHPDMEGRPFLGDMNDPLMGEFRDRGGEHDPRFNDGYPPDRFGDYPGKRQEFPHGPERFPEDYPPDASGLPGDGYAPQLSSKRDCFPPGTENEEFAGLPFPGDRFPRDFDGRRGPPYDYERHPPRHYDDSERFPPPLPGEERFMDKHLDRHPQGPILEGEKMYPPFGERFLRGPPFGDEGMPPRRDDFPHREGDPYGSPGMDRMQRQRFNRFGPDDRMPMDGRPFGPEEFRLREEEQLRYGYPPDDRFPPRFRDEREMDPFMDPEFGPRRRPIMSRARYLEQLRLNSIDYTHRPAVAVLGDEFSRKYDAFDYEYGCDLINYRVFDYAHRRDRSPFRDRFLRDRELERMDRVRDNGRERDRDRERDKDFNERDNRDRNRDRDNRNRDRDVDRDRKDSRDRDRDRDRDREKDRDNRRDWDRDRERTKDKDREDTDNRVKRSRWDNQEDNGKSGSKEKTTSDGNAKKHNGERSSEDTSLDLPGQFGSQADPFKSETANETVIIKDLLYPPGRFDRPKQLVIILRGLPGSGKTYVAKLIKDKEVENGGSAPRILSLDDYFMAEAEVTETDPETGKKVKRKAFQFEYEAEMEEAYRSSLFKSFKKTIDDRFFPFIIVDAIHDKAKQYDQYWSYAKQRGFQVYIAEMDCKDPVICHKRNIHKRTIEDTTKLLEKWEPKPRHFLSIDIRSLLQDVAITEVEMEDFVDTVAIKNDDREEEDETDDPMPFHVPSRWEKLEATEEKLDQLDGLRTSKKKHSSMEDYLQLPDDYEERPCEPGKKRVRWADLEERKEQDRLRAIGFVVGQTDWAKLTDPTHADRALTHTKYI